MWLSLSHIVKALSGTTGSSNLLTQMILDNVLIWKNAHSTLAEQRYAFLCSQWHEATWIVHLVESLHHASGCFGHHLSCVYIIMSARYVCVLCSMLCESSSVYVHSAYWHKCKQLCRPCSSFSACCAGLCGLLNQSMLLNTFFGLSFLVCSPRPSTPLPSQHPTIQVHATAPFANGFLLCTLSSGYIGFRSHCTGGIAAHNICKLRKQHASAMYSLDAVASCVHVSKCFFRTAPALETEKKHKTAAVDSWRCFSITAIGKQQMYVCSVPHVCQFASFNEYAYIKAADIVC